MTEDEAPGRAARDMGSRAIAALVGAGIGGAPGAMAAVALEPMLIQLAARSWEELGELRRRSAGLLIRAASEESGKEPDELTRRALETEATAQLLADALQAAVTTSNHKKIQALGRALANGLSGDEARVDEERLIIAGLSGLEAPHIRALAHLPRQRSRPTTTPNSSATGASGRRGVRAAVLADVTGLSLAGVTNVLAELVRAGMASRDTYAAERRHDRLLLDVQEEVAKLQWLANNPGKKAPTNKRSKALKKPGAPIEPGYERTPFGDICLEYLGSLPGDEAADRADGLRAEDDLDA